MTKIRFPDSIFGKEVQGAIDRVLSTPQPNEKIVQPDSVKSISDFWRIDGVDYRNRVYTVDLAKQLLDDGKNKTQQQWAEYTNQAQNNNDFYVGDMPLYHAVFRALFKMKNTTPDAQEARDFIQQNMRSKYLMTLTRIVYKPTNPDKIIHNFGTKDAYEQYAEIVGPDRAITNKDKSALNATLCSDDVNEIKQIYNWINDTETYIWRLNSKPENIEERVARFVAYSGRAYLSFYGDPDGSSVALGVRHVRKKI